MFDGSPHFRPYDPLDVTAQITFEADVPWLPLTVICNLHPDGSVTGRASDGRTVKFSGDEFAEFAELVRVAGGVDVPLEMEFMD